MQDLISVIVPVYKVEKYLDACVESIVNQTYKNLEIILVDDGSPDNCPAMCDEWAKRDNRIKVIHKANGGLSDARNAGMDVSTGNYIGFVDSDDIISHKMYEILYYAVKKHDADFIQCDKIEFSNINELSFSDSKEITENTYDSFKAVNSLLCETDIVTTCWNTLSKSSISKSVLFEAGKINEDVLWTYRVLSKSDKIISIDSKLYGYYQRPGSIMNSNYTEKRFDALYSLEQRAKEIKTDFPELYPKALKNYVGGCMYHYQTLCRVPQTDEYKKFKKIIHKRFCESDLKTVFNATSLKYKIWYILFRICPNFTCKIRNTLKIGL